jgi:hypothetical protein
MTFEHMALSQDLITATAAVRPVCASRGHRIIRRGYVAERLGRGLTAIRLFGSFISIG